MLETQEPGVEGVSGIRAPEAVRGPYKDRFVNGQVAGVIRVSVPLRLEVALGRLARRALEFLIADQSKDAQELMLNYLATTDATGELPLYNPDTYARALESGRVPGRRSTNEV